MADKIVRMSIAMKAALFVSFLFVLCAVFVVSLNLVADRRLTLDETRGRAEQLARSSAALAADAVATENVALLSRFLEEVSRQPGVTHAYVLGADGRVLADGDAEPGSSFRADRLAAEAWSSNRERSVVENREVNLAVPIRDGDDFIGVLRLTMSLEALATRASNSLLRNIWLNLLGLGLALPLTGLAITRVMVPVRRLTEASERVAARDLSARIDVRTGDELEVLAATFNEMMEQLKIMMDRVRRLAFVDELTRLPNKTAFMERARRAIKDEGATGAILLIDLDRFKRFNDTYGETEGDRILSAAGDRLRRVARDLQDRYEHPDAKPPVLTRLSGDEFALLICGPAPTGVAKQTARDIVAALREPLHIAGHQVTITASVGIARFPLDAAEADHVMRNANLALDAAKAEGGGVFRFFEPDMTRRAVERVTLENELRQACAAGDFVVHYQPKIDARSGMISGCEALVRWRRGDRIVGPGAFIEAAEETGLIIDIGQFVLEESCRAAKRWRDAGYECHVAVNVSGLQVQCEGFTRSVLQALRDADLPPESLELELTESIAMDDTDMVISQVEPLRAKGVRFAIDDFGTGYSSLGSLTKLPFDVFKIDQSFVRRMETDAQARVVIETILAMARALGYDTVAEGVETQAQFAFLQLNGCTTAQGWYFGRPVAEDAFFERLKTSAPRAARFPLGMTGTDGAP